MIVITTDGISDEQRATLQFKAARADMMQKLTAPGSLDALCAHEAAHLVYYEMMGHQTGVQVLPPKLEYSAEKQVYVGYLAAILPDEEPLCEFDKWQEYVTGMAYVNVAGGVVARKMLSLTTGGDEGDKEKFMRICGEIVEHAAGAVSIDVEQCWSWARTEVEKQLEEHPEIMERIQKRAAELRAMLDF